MNSFFLKGDLKYSEILAQSFSRKFPKSPAGWNILGCVYAQTKRFDLALSAFNKIIKMYPNDPIAHNNAGNVFISLGRLDEGILCFKKSIKIKPDFFDAYNNLANAVEKRGEFALAEELFSKAVCIKPDFSESHYNLGNLYHKLGKFEKAINCYKATLKYDPLHSMALNNMGLVYNDLGMHAEAKRCYENSIRANPLIVENKCNLLYLKSVLQDFSNIEYLNDASLLGKEISSSSQMQYSHNEPNLKEDQIRIGFVSGDLKSHPVGYFIESLMHGAREMGSNTQYIAFSTSSFEDETSARLKKYLNEWIPIDRLSDAEAARLIYQTRINVLFDLSGYTAN
ncbi:tetratricopeptide repeat protein, partial [Flavobacterium sp.]|uniref:tetratricopeptide repeat protein n=1 Tax=Flavobacterium sp. TaxID=239 RepID=UPI0037BEC811